ncbi:MAG: class I SAM-dependent methyltransferase [Spirochaetia bacterium]|nr:class I SAM-dependent methyltransferase [Spirochaetia bacterium]
MKLTDKEFWKASWKKYGITDWVDEEQEFVPEWHNVLYKTLLEYKGKDYFEIGCFPGRYLNYFYKMYGMKINGIEFLAFNKKKSAFKIYTGDFLQFHSKKKYDLVCSFGFVEHFKDFPFIIKKHIDIVNPNGIVLIVIPNFVHGLRFFIRRKLDKELFQIHFQNSMNIKILKNELSKLANIDFSINRLKFSDKYFYQVSKTKKKIGKFLSFFIRMIPPLDRGLSAEIIVLIRPRKNK